jgi:hypothetical protein
MKPGVGEVFLAYANLSLRENPENLYKIIEIANKHVSVGDFHANPTVTLNIYAHLMKSTNQEAVCRLEERVFGINGDQMETSTKKEATVVPVTP